MTNNTLHFSYHHPKLRHGVLDIGRNCQAMQLIDHKLVTCTREGTFKAKLPQPLDKIPALTRHPPAHSLAPYSNQYWQLQVRDASI
nr:hypothetical protein GZ27G5_21 [uncultured archaeon GZfos27G5]